VKPTYILKGVVLVNAKKILPVYLLIIAVVLISFSFNAEEVHANISVPDIIKVGLSFGQARENLFNLGSETGMKISVFENGTYKDLFELKSPNAIKIRRDEYYNIVNGKEVEINYVRAAKYEGEVIGPYHIQIGDVYSDIEKAKKVRNQISSVTSSVFLAYEGGWKVWSQMYLDENECLGQIKVMQNEISDVRYSVVHPDKKRIQIVNSATGELMFILNSETKIRVTPMDEKGKVSAILYKGKKFRGSMTMQSLSGSDVTLVNELPLGAAVEVEMIFKI